MELDRNLIKRIMGELDLYSERDNLTHYSIVAPTNRVQITYVRCIIQVFIQQPVVEAPVIQSFAMMIENMATANSFKHRIAERTKIPMEWQLLKSKGKLLEDDKVLLIQGIRVAIKHTN